MRYDSVSVIVCALQLSFQSQVSIRSMWIVLDVLRCCISSSTYSRAHVVINHDTSYCCLMHWSLQHTFR
jgi:hypothetical protein